MTENGEGIKGKKQSSELKAERRNDHDGDTKHVRPTIWLGNLCGWKLIGSGQVDEPLPK